MVRHLAQITLPSGVQPPWVTTPAPSTSVPGCPAAWVWGLPVSSVLPLGPVRIPGFPGNGKHVSSLGAPSLPGAAVAEETLQPSWALAGEGGCAGKPQAQPQACWGPALKAHFWAQTTGQVLGREGIPGSPEATPFLC